MKAARPNHPSRAYTARMSHAPAETRLITPRLRLRWLTEDDAELMRSIWNDPEFIRHVGDRGIRSTAEARQAMRDGILKLYSEQGYGPYRVEAHEGSAALGICGLFKRDNLDFPDIGYSLLPGARGRGYALEAARAVLTHARDHQGFPRLFAIVSRDNSPSLRLLEKLGMRSAGEIRMPGDDEDVALYLIEFPGKEEAGVETQSLTPR